MWVGDRDLSGGVHVMRILWQQHAQEEDWGFLLIDAHNAFIEENRKAMLWEVRNDLPIGARFAFNCYRHCATLVIRSGNGNGHFLYSKEVLTQRDPLEMVAYRLGILPLIRYLRTDHPSLTQPWYTDDSEEGGTLADI